MTDFSKRSVRTVTVAVVAVLVAVTAVGAFALPAAATWTDDGESDGTFDAVTAQVTDEASFTGKVSEVTFEYQASHGDKVIFNVEGEYDYDYASGDTDTEEVHVGGWFFAGEEYPVEVTAKIEGGEQCSATINEGDDVVTLCEDDGEKAPPNFTPTIDGTNAPVTEGETVSVDATVTNDGEREDTQSVDLTVDGQTVASQDVTLAGGSSQSVSLDWTTAAGDAGDHNVEVATENATDATTVTVESQAPPNFQVGIDATNSPVTEGDTLTVDATVQNTGDTAGTQTVSLDVAGAERDSQSVSLAAGASQTVSLSWATASGDAGDYTATVASDNDSATAGVTVEGQAPPNFQVSTDATNSPVVEGETLTVDATVQNTGDTAGTQTVSLDVAGAERDSQSVSLAAGASQTVSLSWMTASGDNGTYTATVASDNDTGTADVTVTEQVPPPNFQVNIDGTNSPVTEGDTLTVDATVTNTGGSADTQTVSFDVGSASDSQSVSLSAGASQSLTFSWQTADGDAGSYTATVASNNDTATAGVTVEDLAPPNFQVNIDGTNSPVTEGDTLTVDATVQNTGGSAGTQTISLDVAGAERDSQSVSLTAGGSQSLSLSWATASGDNGSYTATVASDNDTATAPVDVQAATQYESFTAVTEDGYLQLGRNENQTKFEFNECPGGNAVGGSEDPADLPHYQANNTECIEFTADYHPNNGTYTIAPGDFHFPDLVFYSETLSSNLTVEVSAPNGLTGTIDPDTGTGTFSGNMRSEIPALDDGSEPTCGMDVTVSGTTGTSGPLTGSPDPVNSSDVAQPSLVDGEFSVPASSGCGALAPAVNGEVPLPSDSGQNELVMDLLLNFSEQDP